MKNLINSRAVYLGFILGAILIYLFAHPLIIIAQTAQFGTIDFGEIFYGFLSFVLNAVAFVGLLLFAGAVYFLPSIMAVAGKHKQSDAIVVLNLFLGWTLLGWVGAMVWSMMK